MKRLAMAVVAALVLLPSAAHPHDRGTSYSTWTVTEDSARVTVRISELDLSRFPWGTQPGPQRDEAARAYIPRNLELYRGPERCVATTARPLRSAPGHVTYEWSFRCAAVGTFEIRSTLLAEVSPSHLHFARVSVGDAPAVEKVLSTRGARWALSVGREAEEPEGTSVSGYLFLGIEHILTGYDHLAFVLALLLLGTTLGEMAKIVTGFTVAHSLTLGLMVLGYARPQPGPVEALIGLSIGLVAAENLWQFAGRQAWMPTAAGLGLVALGVLAWLGVGSVAPSILFGLAIFAACYFRLVRQMDDASTLRWGVAFLFGLIHGFGFASMLTEAGLPSDRLVAALLGFNLGVELGQLAVVAIAWPLLAWVGRASRGGYRWVTEFGSASVLALGMYWFVMRTFG